MVENQSKAGHVGEDEAPVRRAARAQSKEWPEVADPVTISLGQEDLVYATICDVTGERGFSCKSCLAVNQLWAIARSKNARVNLIKAQTCSRSLRRYSVGFLNGNKANL